MKVTLKKLLLGLAATGCIAIALIFGLAGPRDGSLRLAGDYYFTHSGGDRNSITEERNGASSLVVPMKVEEFIVEGNGIFVTRRPVLRENVGRDLWIFRLTDTCEYYRIDVQARKLYGPFTSEEVKGHIEWNFLKGRGVDDGFGPTKCKLGTIWS